MSLALRGKANVPGPDLEHGVILYLEDVSVAFDGFKALNRLSLTIDAGELRCLIGPNGAGKTTLMDVITGKTRPDSGSAFYGQRLDLTKMSEADIARAGIGRKFQKPTIFEQMSVIDNLRLALRDELDVWATLLTRFKDHETERLYELLETVGLKPDAHVIAGGLSHGQKQWLEIGMLLAQEPQLLLVDEPVAGMTEQETARTAQLLTDLAGDRSVVVVEHDMAFVRSIAKNVTVLHEGSVLAEGTMQEMQTHPEVTRVYLGS